MWENFSGFIYSCFIGGDWFHRKMIKYLSSSIPNIFQNYPLPPLWVMTPLTRVVQPLSEQHRICLNAGHSLRKAQKKTFMAGFGPTSCSFPYQAKGNGACRRNCRTRVSAGRCHQCQQNYTPRELKPFKSGRYFNTILRRFQRETLLLEHLILPVSKKWGKSEFQNPEMGYFLFEEKWAGKDAGYQGGKADKYWCYFVWIAFTPQGIALFLDY